MKSIIRSLIQAFERFFTPKMGLLSREDNVVRYVKYTSIKENGEIDGSEFRLRPHRPDEAGLSVNWLECFGSTSKEEQVQNVRKHIHIKKLGAKACFAELPVGEVIDHVHSELDSLVFLHDPLRATDEFPADPSHAEIQGLPPGDSDLAAPIGDMIAECVSGTYPARDPST